MGMPKLAFICVVVDRGNLHLDLVRVREAMRSVRSVLGCL
jgi:hypothetical protein